MSNFIMFLIVIFIISVIGLNPKSKTCKLNFKFGFSGLNFDFETNEKSTPSDRN